MLQKLTFFILLSFLSLNISSQTNWHVATNGIDADGNGTEINPFASLQFAANKVQPGDTVYVHEGTYRNNDFNDDDIWEGNNLLKITANGTVDNYITFMPYPGDHVLLEFDGNHGVVFSNTSYIIFDGFEVKGISDHITQSEADDAWGLYIDKADGLIYNLEDEIGIKYPDPSPYQRGYKISKVSKSITKPSYYSGKGIVASKSHHIIIRNNIVRDTPGSGIRANGSDYVTISNNEVYNCTFYTTAGSGAVTVAEATVLPDGDTYMGSKIILENNYVHHNENRMVSYAPSKDFLTFVIDEGTGLFLTRNTTYNHGYIKISNNVSAYNGASGIVCHFTNRAIIEHNTLYKNGTTNDSAAGGIGINNADDVSVINNISYAEPNHWALGILANPVTNLEVASNILYNENGSEFVTRNIATGWIEVNPLFEATDALNFVLSKNSPAVNASTTTQTELFDILGNPRNDGSPDLGAYERSQTTGYELVEKMGRGINLGNVLSAPVEGNWAAKATEQYFKDVAEAGFTNVRIPLDFFGYRTTGNTNVYDSNAGTANIYDGNITDYTVDETYLNRIEEIVNWSLNIGLITTIDLHGSDLKNEFLYTFKSDKSQYTNPTSAKRKADLEKFSAIWTAIANRFKKYNQNLLFEVVNEPYFDVSAAEMDAINTNIINVIRNSGENNTTRFIIITGGSKNAYEAPLQIDPAIIANNDNLIATFHYYKPFKFTSSSKEKYTTYTWGSDTDKETIIANFDEVKEWSTNNKIPIFLGEFGADNENGFNYSTGNYGDFGGPEEASRVEYHHYLAEQAIDRGFSFAAWDAGNESNKTIHKRTDDSTVVNYYSDGSEDTTKWVENVKQALLGAGTWPDCNDPSIISDGCDKFSVLSVDETCVDSKNGSINIEAPKTLNYKATVVGEGISIDKGFTSNTEISGLSAGDYNLCISVEGQVGFKQCYTITINAPQVLSVSSKVDATSKKISLSLSGAKKYSIKLNDKNYTTTNSDIILDLTKSKNNINVSTDKNCQGLYNEIIDLSNEIMAYPNPVQHVLQINSPFEISSVEIFNAQGQRIISKQKNAQAINCSALKSGFYIAKIDFINGDSSTQKFIKE